MLKNILTLIIFVFVVKAYSQSQTSLEPMGFADPLKNSKQHKR